MSANLVITIHIIISIYVFLFVFFSTHKTKKLTFTRSGSPKQLQNLTLQSVALQLLA